METITHSRAETVALGKRMAAVLSPGSLVAFTGGLGEYCGIYFPYGRTVIGWTWNSRNICGKHIYAGKEQTAIPDRRCAEWKKRG